MLVPAVALAAKAAAPVVATGVKGLLSNPAAQRALIKAGANMLPGLLEGGVGAFQANKQLREAKEVFARYDDANFIHDEDEEIDAFHEFAERMAKLSPECLDVASPYLN